MTPQEVFKKLIEQGGPSKAYWNSYAHCAYRGVEGRKCAAGWLLPDEVEEHFNQASFLSLPDRFQAAALEELDAPQIIKRGLICAMQAAHDSASTKRGGTWEERLRREWNHHLPEVYHI